MSAEPVIAASDDTLKWVDWRKQRELGRSAKVWISRHGRRDEAYRFDVV